MDSNLDELRARATELGVEHGYWDISGNWIDASEQELSTLISLLSPISEHSDSASCSKKDCTKVDWPATLVRAEGADIEFIGPKATSDQAVKCTVLLEDSRTQDAQLLSLESSQQQASGSRFRLSTAKLNSGYHQLSIDSSVGEPNSIFLIITPRSCFNPASLDSSTGSRHFGLSVQTYRLWDEQEAGAPTQGIGTFSDLAKVCRQLRDVGGSFVGINPLHALGRGEWSPYAPDSRFALNSLYIDRNAVSKLFGVEIAPELDVQFSELIDYEREFIVQEEFLRGVYTAFREKEFANQELVEEFQSFLADVSPELRSYAHYQCLQRQFSEDNSQCYGWQQWPEAYQCPDSPEVVEFASKRQTEIDFELFVQWIAQRQLSECVEVFSEVPGAIGLYTDMALGVRANSADAWIFRDCYVFGASIGAPPDAFNPSGQDWGLPPLNPASLVLRGYSPFILALRQAMRFAGAVRIDHVMSLFRLFWVLPEKDGQKQGGCYVRYPVEDLFGILALESQRNNCLVVGEDLGTVPDEVRSAMHRFAVLSYKVLIFMRDWEGRFQGKEAYDELALVTVSTHDLPTVSAYVTAADLDVRLELQLQSESEIEAMRQERNWAKQCLGDLLRDYGAQSGEAGPDVKSFVQASARFISATPCQLCVLQLEDLALEKEQVNIPGTTVEHPNWRRRLPTGITKLFAQSWVQELFADLKASRS